MSSLPQGWSIVDGKLRREVVLRDFGEAMRLVNRVAELAEAAQHHPDMTIQYNRVVFTLWTHDTGGLTDRDHALAAAIEAAVGSGYR
jgi:4a-hydroxytetrahydrobiopterin dehydratase